MIFGISDNSCEVYVEDNLYQEYKTKILNPSISDEDDREYMEAHLRLYAHMAVKSLFQVKGEDINKMTTQIIAV